MSASVILYCNISPRAILNTAMGYAAGLTLTTGGYNTLIGSGAGLLLTT